MPLPSEGEGQPEVISPILIPENKICIYMKDRLFIGEISSNTSQMASSGFITFES